MAEQLSQGSVPVRIDATQLDRLWRRVIQVTDTVMSTSYSASHHRKDDADREHDVPSLIVVQSLHR